jgi:hypothetical protein
MKLLGAYKNGNYNVVIFNDGTKIRKTDENEFKAEFPECMDIKITNYCNMGCPYCHEDSNTEGKHGDILNAKFIDSLHPYTELAIGGGNPLSHPDLKEFLVKLKAKKIIANMTVNQNHFLKNKDLLKNLMNLNLIKGLGISFIKPTDELIQALKEFPNAVLHVINGVVNYMDLKELFDNDFKILILGYKEFRRGKEFHSEEIEYKKTIIYDKLEVIVNRFKVVSFDNLALKQLNVKRLMTEEEWEKFYMGDDGKFTMYIDMVNQKFAQCSVAEKRYDLLDNIKDMFKVILETEK